MEYKTIICPIDKSELREKVLDAAAYLGRLSGAKVVLMSVVEKWYHAQHVSTDSPEWTDIHEGWLKEGRDLLDKEANALRDRGLTNCETVLRDGDAAYEIIALANERRADLIIMATHHYSPIGKLFMGSVTDKVTKKSPCPVLWLLR
jgi:nucleotide-binding universal stress UspA family protein